MKSPIIVAYSEQYAPHIRRIRKAVFTFEQGIDEHLDLDGKDPEAIHVLVGSETKFVGTGRLLVDGHIGRLAVLKAYRGNAYGADALKALMQEARRIGINRVFLGAQAQALGFYLRLGFTEYDEPFLDAGIKHMHMEKTLNRKLSKKV